MNHKDCKHFFVEHQLGATNYMIRNNIKPGTFHLCDVCGLIGQDKDRKATMRNKISKRLNKLARLLKSKPRALKALWNAVPKPERNMKDIDTQIAKLTYGD